MTVQPRENTPGRRQRGRPRDPRIEPAVLRATRQLLAEEGWSGFSVTEVARRAGVTKPALYRRWPSRGALIYDAVFAASDDVLAVPDTGSVVDDLVAGLSQLVRIFQTDAGIASGRAVMVEMAGGTAELRARLRDGRYRVDNAAVAEMFRRGRARGEYVPPLADEVLTEIFIDWVVSRCVLRDDPPSDADIVAAVHALLLPPGAASEPREELPQ